MMPVHIYALPGRRQQNREAKDLLATVSTANERIARFCLFLTGNAEDAS
jgi:hypothetical protein